MSNNVKSFKISDYVKIVKYDASHPLYLPDVELSDVNDGILEYFVTIPLYGFDEEEVKVNTVLNSTKDMLSVTINCNNPYEGKYVCRNTPKSLTVMMDVMAENVTFTKYREEVQDGIYFLIFEHEVPSNECVELIKEINELRKENSRLLAEIEKLKKQKENARKETDSNPFPSFPTWKSTEYYLNPYDHKKWVDSIKCNKSFDDEFSKFFEPFGDFFDKK